MNKKITTRFIGQGPTLSIAIAVWVALATYTGNIAAQTTTPINQDVTVSTTIKVPSGETPTPSPTAGPTPTPAPTAGPTITPFPSPTISPPPVVPTTAKVKLIIFGYAPANTPVSLTGKNVLELTTSNRNGYFEFVNVPLPDITEGLIFYPELCLQAYYKEVSTQPVCLPGIPTGQDEYKIGPVLISPILIIEKQEALVNSQIKATGKAIPNSPVFVYLAKEKSQGIINILENIKIIQTASAYYLPKYEVRSDENGNFEFNLPTESQARWRIFTAYSFQNQNSPKSNTLSYQVASPFLEILNKIIMFILNFVLGNPIIAFIAFEVILTIILIYLITKEKGRNKNKRPAKKGLSIQK